MLGSLVAAVMLASALASAEAQPPSSTDGIIITSATFGEVDPNGIVPTTNGVPGAGVNNLDIATPTALLNIGQQYAFTMTFDDITFSGACEPRAVITQMQNGKRVEIWGYGELGASCTPGTVYVLSTRSSKLAGEAGPAMLTVTVKYGTGTARMKLPLDLH